MATAIYSRLFYASCFLNEIKRRKKMNKFVESCIEKSQEKLTENGAFAYNTSGDKVLDFFSTAGALRSRTEEDIIRKFELAYLANRNIALRMLFYTSCLELCKLLLLRHQFLNIAHSILLQFCNP